MKKLCALILLGGFALPPISQAIDLKQAKFTQVVNNVEVISAANKSLHAASVNDVFKMPDVLRTGAGSRAELVAEDNTITRVGANTIFSFDPSSRTIDLQQGSLLFHSPTGKGGGTIRTGSATASVLGTTIIVTTTPSGGFKVLVLEGQAEVRFLTGQHITLRPGQMTFILPGGGTSPIVVFRLDDQTQGSLLVNGFTDPLPSWSKIQTEITRQLLLLLNNKVQDTDLVVGDNATPDTIQVRMDLLNGQPPLPNASIIGSDHTPNQPLPVSYDPPSNIPLDPTAVRNTSFTPPADFSDGLTFLGIVTPASGFVGNNIDIDTGPDTPVDLTSFAANPDFDIMAKGDLRIWQSLYFTGTSVDPISGSGLPGTVGLFAGGQMLIAPESTLEADTGIFGLVAGSFGVLDTSTGQANPDYPNTIFDVSIYNEKGDVDVLSLSDLTIEGMDSYWTVYAGGSVNIQSDGTLTLGAISTESRTDSGHEVAIDAGGDVALTAGLTTSGDLNVGNAEIYAGDNGGAGQASYSGGSINMNAGGNVLVTGSYLSAYSGEIGYGDVNIFGVGNVDIEDTYIHAGGDVNIESGNSLTLGYDSSWEIGAAGSIYLTADTSDVYVDYDLYAGGDVDITSGGSVTPAVGTTVVGSNIDVEDSDIYAGDNGNLGQASYSGGAVNIYAYNGNVTLNNDDIHAYSGDSSDGDVNVDGSGNVGVQAAYIGADGNVDIQAGGALTLGDGVSISQLGIEHNVVIDAQGSVYLTAQNDLDLYNAEAAAEGGDVVLNSSTGNINVETSSYLYADGTVSLHAANSVYMDNTGLQARNEGDADVLAGTDIGIYASTIEAGGKVDIEAGGALTIGTDPQSFDVSITAGGGGVTLLAGGNADVIDTYINTGGDVDITGGGTISSGVGKALTGGGNVDLEASSMTAGSSVNIQSLNGTIDIEGTYISAQDYVNVASWDTLTLGSTSSDEIDAKDYISLKSVNSDVNVDYDLYAGGDVDITSGGTVLVALDSTVTGGNINIENSHIEVGDSDLSSTGGAVNIYAWNGNVYLSDDGIYAHAAETTTSGNVNNSAAGNVNINAAGYVDVESSDINQDDSVYANAGDYVKLYDVNNDAYDGNSADTYLTDWNIQAGSYVDISADENVQIYNGNIYANGGDVDITSGEASISVAQDGTDSGGNITIGNSYIQASDAMNVTANDGGVCIYGVSTLYAENGNVSITATGAGSGSDIDVYSSTLEANGSVYLNADGDINISDGTVISAVTGNMPVGGSVGSGDTVSISSGGQLTINGNFGENNFGYDIGADYKVCLWGENGVSIDAALIETLDGSSCDRIKITADGEIDITDGSELDSLGSVKVEAYYGDANVLDSAIFAEGGDVYVSSDSGMLTVNANHDFTIPTSPAGNDADIYASGNVTLDGECVEIKDTSILAGNEVDITGWDGNVKVKDADIETDFGDINMSAYSGSLTLDSGCQDYGVYVEAGGAVNLSADGDVKINGGAIYADGGDVTINSGGAIGIDTVSSANSGVIIGGDSNIQAWDSVNVTADDGGVCTYGDSTLYAENGNVNITATGAGSGSYIDVYSSTLEANGSVYLNADGDINISDGTVISATAGNVPLGESAGSGDKVSISSGGTVNITGNFGDNGFADYDIGADTEVCIYGYDGVNISDAAITTLDGNSADAVEIHSGGTMDLESDTIYSDGSVTISGDGNVKVNGSTITADDGDASISSNYGMLAVNANHDFGITISSPEVSYDIDASGYVYLNGDCVTIKDTAIHTGQDVDVTSYDGNTKIKDTEIVTDFGDVNISAYYGDLTLDSGCADYGVYIEAGDNVSLNADSGVNIFDSVIYADGGDVTINSGKDLDLDDGNLDYGVYIEAAGSVTMSTGGDADIYDSLISADGGAVTITANGSLSIGAGDNYGSVSGNNVTFTAYTGGVSVSGEDINAKNGDLTINAGSSGEGPGSVGKHGGHFLPAGTGRVVVGGNKINVNTGIAIPNNLTGSPFNPADTTISQNDIDEEGQTITDPGSIDLMAVNTVTVNNSTLTAEGGHVGISGGGAVSISGSSIYADAGDVDITSSGSTVDLENTYIFASGDANFESSGTLTLGFTSGNTISADGAVSLKSDNGDVDVNNYTIYSYGANGTGINAAGNVSLTGDDIEAYDSGGLSITALGTSSTVDIEGAYLGASGDVNVESSDTLTLGFTSGGTVSAGGVVSLKSDKGDVDVYNYNIYSYGANASSIKAAGNVNLVGDDIQVYDSAGLSVSASGTSSTVDIEDTYLYVSGDMNIESGGTLTLNTGSSEIETAEASGTLFLKSDNGDVDVNNYNLYADNGDVTLNAVNGNIDLENSYLDANDTVNVTGYGDVYFNNDSIYAENGNINVSSTGAIFPAMPITVGMGIENSTLEAYNGGVSIGANGGVYFYSANVYADYGDLNVNSYGSVVDIQNSTMNASGNVNIDSSEMLTLGSIDTVVLEGGAADTIEADGSVSLTSDVASVDVYGSDVFADGGFLSIQAYFGSVDIENSDLGADSDNNVSISGSYGSASGNVYINAYGGNIDINAGNNLTILNSTFDLGGNITICGSTITADEGDVDINTYGSLSITAGGNENISGASISGDEISISGSTITANTGNVNIEVNGSISVLDISAFDTSSAGNIDISGSTITADAGIVNISTPGDVDIEYSSISGGIANAMHKSLVDGDVNVNAGGFVNDYGSSLNLNYWYIDAGAYVDLGADGSVTVNFSDITASGGNAAINSGVGIVGGDGSINSGTAIGWDVDISGSMVTAGGDADINSGIGFEGGAGSINTATATGGNADIFSSSSIMANGDANINGGTGFDGGEGVINSGTATGGNADIFGSTISADENVTINGGIGFHSGDGSINGSAATGGNADIFGSMISANGDVTVNGGIGFFGGIGSINTSMATGGNVDISSGSTISANGNVNISSGTGFVGFFVGIDSLNTGTVAGGNVNVSGGSTISAGGNTTISAGGGLTVDNSTIEANTSSGTVALNNASGQTTIKNGSSMQAFYISVNSPDGILIDGTSGGHLSGNTMNLTSGMGGASGGPTITLQNENLANLTIVNVQSHTVNLDSVNFSSSSSYNFTSFYHAFHINDGHVGGYVNFNNDTLDTNTAIISSDPAGTVNPNNNGGIVLGGSGSGIHIN